VHAETSQSGSEDSPRWSRPIGPSCSIALYRRSLRTGQLPVVGTWSCVFLRKMVTSINRKYEAPRDTDSMTDVIFYSPAIWSVHWIMTESREPRCPDNYKVKFTLEQATKVQREESYSSTLSLTLAQNGVAGQRRAAATLPPGKRPNTLCIAGLVGPRAGLDGCRKSRPYRDSIPGPSSP
jgi:hypothetical protein